MRRGVPMRSSTFAAVLAAALAAVPLVTAQNPVRMQPAPFIPLHQSGVPQLNPAASGVPSTTVYAPPYYRSGVSYANTPGAFSYYNGNNPYGYSTGNFSGYAPSS